MPRPPESRRAASPERATRKEPPGVLLARLLGLENERSLSAPGARDSAEGHSIDPCALGARPTAGEPGTYARHSFGQALQGRPGPLACGCDCFQGTTTTKNDPIGAALAPAFPLLGFF